jgi:hypothetical protein
VATFFIRFVAVAGKDARAAHLRFVGGVHDSATLSSNRATVLSIHTHPAIRLLLGTTEVEYQTKSPPKPRVHKKVCYRIATGMRKRQQVEIANSFVSEILVNERLIEQSQCIDNVQWRPTDEKLQYDNKQHLYNALLTLKFPFRR